MTPSQRAAHQRLLASLPVRTISEEEGHWQASGRALTQEERQISQQLAADDEQPGAIPWRTE